MKIRLVSGSSAAIAFFVVALSHFSTAVLPAAACGAPPPSVEEIMHGAQITEDMQPCRGGSSGGAAARSNTGPSAEGYAKHFMDVMKQADEKSRRDKMREERVAANEKEAKADRCFQHRQFACAANDYLSSAFLMKKYDAAKAKALERKGYGAICNDRVP